ncbi:MAG: NAD(P)-binding domain-containing protein [Bacteriovorax sp.]|nr:NAD(P)-binding domain-containing protein [Bacteriovorax sp.]
MDVKKLKITVIGCGWLGLPLCERLIADGHKVVTTTTTPEKKEQLSKKLDIHLFDVISQVPDQNLLACDVIIYTIPPLGLGEIERFFHAVDPDSKIIFISSTSVYGKSSGAINEDSELTPQTKNGKYLKASESYLRSHFKNLTIVRPGGLYGESRHPVYFLQGKTDLTTGQELLHLVHLDDCIEAIDKIIENQSWSEDFNLVNDLRISKEDYYTDEARKLGLTPPSYIHTPQENPTNISNEKSKKLLSMQYKNQQKLN